MTSILKVDEIQNTDGKTGLVITPDGSVSGVKFPEAVAPVGRTITSTTMSSYEEGTWNPEMETGSARFLETRYVRINNFIQLRVYVDQITDITSSNGFTITNLPFTPSQNSESAVSACMYRYVVFPNGYNSLVGYLTASNEIRAYFLSESSNYRVLEHRDLAIGSTNANFRFDFTYYTDDQPG